MMVHRDPHVSAWRLVGKLPLCTSYVCMYVCMSVLTWDASIAQLSLAAWEGCRTHSAVLTHKAYMHTNNVNIGYHPRQRMTVHTSRPKTLQIRPNTPTQTQVT